MTVVMQAVPTATGTLPGASSPFANAAGAAAPADGSPFAAMLLAFANMQAAGPATPAAPGTPAIAIPPATEKTPAPGTPVSPAATIPADSAPAATPAPSPTGLHTAPIVVSLEQPAATATPAAQTEPVEVVLLDPLDGDENTQDPALSAQVAVLANQTLAPQLPQETSPLLEAAVSEEVLALSTNGADPDVVVSPDALMPALPVVSDEDELRANRPSVLTPLTAAVTEANGSGQPEPVLNATFGDVVSRPLTGPSAAKDITGEHGRVMQPAADTKDTPGVVRFDGNASSQTPTAQPAVTLPLPPAETDPGAARVSILSTFAANPAAATSPVVAPVIANAVKPILDDDSTKSIDNEDVSTEFAAESSTVTPPGPQAASPADLSATGDSLGFETIAPAAQGEAIAAPAALPDAMTEFADDSGSIGPSEIRPPSATAANPAAPTAVGAPIAPGTPARTEFAAGASAPSAPLPTSEPAVQHPSVARVAQTVLDAIESGGGEARIHLQPRELGDVVIHVRTTGDKVEVLVQAERSEAVNVIRENARDLTGLLGESGLNLTDLNVSFGMQQQGRGGWGGDPAPANNRLQGDSEFGAVLGTDPTVANTNHNRLRATYNPDGAHLYRV